MIIKVDKEREWKANLGTYRVFEEVTGKSVMDKDVWNKPMITDILALIYAGLKKGNPSDTDITMEMIEDNLEIEDLEIIFEEIGKELTKKK